MPSPAPFEPQGNAAGSRIGMNELISDFSTHPLVPGALFAAINGDPQSRRTEPLDHAALLPFNKRPLLDIVSHFQNLGVLPNEQASEIVPRDNQYVTAFKELRRRIPQPAPGADADPKSVEEC